MKQQICPRCAILEHDIRGLECLVEEWNIVFGKPEFPHPSQATKATAVVDETMAQLVDLRISYELHRRQHTEN